MGGLIQYGSGPGSDPHGGRDVPYGPEISWPYGFRPLDAESRDLLESAYRPPAVYQQPAVDDDGYGDPGYSDPSYDGPRTHQGPQPALRPPHGGSAFPGRPGPSGGPGSRPSGGAVPGYDVPDSGAFSRLGSGHQPQGFASSAGRPQARPVTGARDALRDTGPQPAAGPRGARDSGGLGPGSGGLAPDSGGLPPAGSAAYPEQWYDYPRLDDRALDAARHDSPQAGPPRSGPPRSGSGRSGSRRSGSGLAGSARSGPARSDVARSGPRSGPAAASPRSAGPRLGGVNYDELRSDDELAPGDPGYDEPLDDESWYQELRHSAPAYPQGFGPEHPSGPYRRMEPQAPDRSQPPESPRAPSPAPGYAPPRGSSVPQMGAGPGTRGGSVRPGAPDGSAPDLGNFLSAPAAQAGVSVLSPPDGTRAGAPPGTGALATPGLFADPDHGSLAAPGTGAFTAAGPVGQVLAPPRAERLGSAAVRPGHGLDGPEITASWPAHPSVDDLDSYEHFWQEDDEDAEYTGLFEDSGTDSARSPAAKRRIGRRRGRSNDHRLWLGLGGVAIVTAAAIAGIVKFEFPSHSGPAHTMVTPDRIGTFARTVDLEHQADVAQLRADVIKMSAGKASRVVSAVYESGNSAAGGTEQIIMFIGGHLANADPGASLASFTQKFPGARIVGAGALGGRAACVEPGNNVALCAWFDNDSFGEIVSPTMNASDLAAAMQTVRPSVEHGVAK